MSYEKFRDKLHYQFRVTSSDVKSRIPGRRHKPWAIVHQQCKDQLLEFAWHANTRQATIRGGGAIVVYSTDSGAFYGWTPEGEHFSQSNTKYRDEDWFKGFINFFYYPEGE